MFVDAYIRSAAQIISEYQGEEPFASFLKKYFATHKKHGSRDRKQISNLCYCYFRLGRSLPDIDVQERILAGLFLCAQTSDPILAFAKPKWNEAVSEDITAKSLILQEEYKFDIKDIFPFQHHLSTEIDPQSFTSSFLIQPDTYIRIRPGNENTLRKKLQNADVSFIEISKNCIAVPPSTKLENYLLINREAVVQDINSQKVLDSLIAYLHDRNKRMDVWDCCAASGGKSILLKDHFPKVQLTVSDVRESIMFNLRKRFKEAGITDYKWFVADVSSPRFRNKTKFDLIICDAPCSGSGTWGRTPEQLSYFKADKISYYSGLQRQIALNSSKYLKEGGMFIYITCSVFKEENENVVDFIQKNCSLQLQASQYLPGYMNKADTLFCALFIR